VPSQELETHQVAAIGPATAAALQERGVVAAYMPDDYVGESLGAGLPISGGDRVLLPRAEGSRPTLPELLVERGAHVDELAIYRSEAVRWDEEIERKLLLGVDAITFTSPSTVMSFVQAGHAADLDPLQLPGEPIVACIGPITASAAKEAGFHVSVTADKYTIPGLVEALQRYFRDRR
jgi:uroporphyrinogen-III synthase